MVSCARPATRAYLEESHGEENLRGLRLPARAREHIKVKIGGKDVEVCCEECATKLREALAKPKKRA